MTLNEFSQKENISKRKPSIGNKFIYRYYDEDGSYVGQTKHSLYHRSGKSGANYLKKSTKWSKAIKEKGFDHFEVEILCECAESEADTREKEYIKMFDSRKNGYNSTPGGIWYNPEWDYEEDDDSPKVWIWKVDESKLSESAKTINKILCKEFNVDSPKDFDKVPLWYGCYALGYDSDDFYEYNINLGLLIDNFEIYEYADYILEEFEKKRDCKKLIDYLYEDYCPFNECFGGDIMTSGEYIY